MYLPWNNICSDRVEVEYLFAALVTLQFIKSVYIEILDNTQHMHPGFQACDSTYSLELRTVQ